MAYDFVPRQTKTKIKESDIQKKCMTWLKEQPDIVCWKASDMYTRGVSDIVMCLRGLFVAIELKKPGEKPTELQKGFIQKVNNINGLAFYCDSVEEVKKAIEYIREHMEEAMYMTRFCRHNITVSQERLEIK